MKIVEAENWELRTTFWVVSWVTGCDGNAGASEKPLHIWLDKSFVYLLMEFSFCFHFTWMKDFDEWKKKFAFNLCAVISFRIVWMIRRISAALIGLIRFVLLQRGDLWKNATKMDENAIFSCWNYYRHMEQHIHIL